MGVKKLKPLTRSKCFAVEDISGETYLTEQNPENDLIYPNEVDLLYREIVEGTFIPIEKTHILNGKLVGYFIDDDEKEYVQFFEVNGEYISDMEWLPISKELVF